MPELISTTSRFWFTGNRRKGKRKKKKRENRRERVNKTENNVSVIRQKRMTVLIRRFAL